MDEPATDLMRGRLPDVHTLLDPRVPASSSTPPPTWLTALAALAPAWLVLSALAPFHPAPDVDVARAISAAMAAPGWSVSALWSAFWTGLFAHLWWMRRMTAGRAGRAPAAGVAPFAGLTVMVLALAIAQAYFPPLPEPAFAWPAHLLGIALGVAGAWASARWRVHELPADLWARLWRACYIACGLLAPLTMAPADSLGGWLAESSALLYRAIRLALPWLPFAVLLGLIGLAPAARVWTLIGLALSVLVAPALLLNFDSRDWLAWLVIAPTLALGLWVGEVTRLAPGWRDGAADGPPADAGAGATARWLDLVRHPDYHPPGSLALLLGASLLALGATTLAGFPRFGGPLALLLTGYALLLWWRPTAWLWVVPMAWPLLDLAPWTGRFYFDEFDLLMLVTAAMLMWRGRPRRPRRAPGGAFLLLAASLTALTAIATLRGVWPLAPLDANAFASYWSPYNGLRVAKGFLWGALIFLWLRDCPLRGRALARPLAIGLALGLLGVGLVGAWEHHLYVGFAQRLETYRIVSLFSSMHTGGGHIEAYLVAAVPFLWLLTGRLRDLALTAPIMILTAYVMLYTVSRGGVAAFGVVVLLLLLASARMAMLTRGRRLLAPVTLLVGVALLLATGAGGGYLMQRFAASGEDWSTRTGHWRMALDLRDDGLATGLLGMGLGTFPRVYLERAPQDKQPATYAFAVEQGNTHLRLGHGDTLYFAQRVPFVAGETYRLEFEARAAREHAAVHVPICEKQLLNSRQCAWRGFDIPAGADWHHIEHEFAHAEVGAAHWSRRPPVELFLYNPGEGGVVEIDNLRLVDSRERDLQCNGTFSRGGDCWFFKTHSHLPWHIKNLWVHLLFEHGWLGVLAFTALAVVAGTRLARAGWRGNHLAWAALASLAGMLTVGLFDSLLDAPRLTAWLIALLLLGAGWHWHDAGRAGAPSARHRPESRAGA
jgi:hypothetical protein